MKKPVHVQFISDGLLYQFAHHVSFSLLINLFLVELATYPLTIVLAFDRVVRHSLICSWLVLADREKEEIFLS